MRALLPSSLTQLNVDVHGFFSTDWLDRGGIRANFIASVDGAIAVSGLSRGLQTPGDNAIFAALRDLADVVLVGAGTATAEGYRPVRPTGERLAQRREAGLADELPIAIVSRSLNVDPGSQLFTATGAGTTIVLTCAAANPDTLTALGGLADVVICGDESVDLATARGALVERGLTRILCEGGPTLFADLAEHGLVEELCLSIAPQVAGPGSGRLAAGPAWSTSRRVELMGLLEEDHALFARYRLLAEG